MIIVSKRDVAVDVPAVRQTVEPHGLLEAPDDIAESLLGQDRNWARAFPCPYCDFTAKNEAGQTNHVNAAHKDDE